MVSLGEDRSNCGWDSDSDREFRQVALRGSFSEQVALVTGPESLCMGHSRNHAEEEPREASSLGCANRNSIQGNWEVVCWGLSQLPLNPVGIIWDTCHLPGSCCWGAFRQEG